eukprot:scaffold1631_cov198-Pinguiococcus_pyrenoidosus.AAC.2
MSCGTFCRWAASMCDVSMGEDCGALRPCCTPCGTRFGDMPGELRGASERLRYWANSCWTSSCVGASMIWLCLVWTASIVKSQGT